MSDRPAQHDGQTRRRIWWKPCELANRWRRSTETVLRWCRTGQLQAMNCGGSFLIHIGVIHEREARGKVKQMAATKRIKRFQCSGVDHFARGQQQ